MKRFLLILGLLFAALPAFPICGQYTFCGTELDYYVPENLMRLADDAEQARLERFLRNLKCWDTGDEHFGRVTCEVDGKKIVWEDERQEFFKPQPVSIMVPVDGVIAIK